MIIVIEFEVAQGGRSLGTFPTRPEAEEVAQRAAEDNRGGGAVSVTPVGGCRPSHPHGRRR